MKLTAVSMNSQGVPQKIKNSNQNTTYASGLNKDKFQKSRVSFGVFDVGDFAVKTRSYLLAKMVEGTHTAAAKNLDKKTSVLKSLDEGLDELKPTFETLKIDTNEVRCIMTDMVGITKGAAEAVRKARKDSQSTGSKILNFIGEMIDGLPNGTGSGPNNRWG